MILLKFKYKTQRRFVYFIHIQNAFDTLKTQKRESKSNPK